MNQDIEMFNKYAKEFLNKMQKLFPNESKLQDYTYMYIAISTLTPLKPVIEFMSHLEPFGIQIMKKEESFFKQDQYVNAAESISGKLGLIEHWDQLDFHTKNSVWEYIQTLYVLGMKITGKTEEFKLIMKQI